MNKTARAIIIQNDKVLLGREKGQQWYFLPGWRIGHGENSESTLANNIREKLASGIENMKYIGATSSVYKLDKNRTHQEFDLVYVVKLQNDDCYFEAGNIEFVWENVQSLGEAKILPKLIKSKLAEWLETKNTFWASA